VTVVKIHHASSIRGCVVVENKVSKVGFQKKISCIGSIEADRHYSGVYTVYLRIRLRTAEKFFILLLGISRSLLNKSHSAPLPAPNCRHLPGQTSVFNKRNGECTLLAIENM
jgi:hypothetical protein